MTLLLAGLAWGLAAHATVGSLRQYFVELMGRPSLRLSYHLAGSLVDQELRAYPGSIPSVSYDLAALTSTNLLYRKDTQQRILPNMPAYLPIDWSRWPQARTLKQFEDFFVFNGAQPRLLLMAPYLREALPWLQAQFPEAEIQVFREDQDPRAGVPAQDPFAPDTQLLRVALNADQVRAFRGLVDLKGASARPSTLRLDVQDQGFAQARSSKPLDLGGLLVQRQRSGMVLIRIAWPGWTAELNGRPWPLGQEQSLSMGTHALRLRGPVPSGARGALPLSIESGGRDLVAEGLLLPVDPRFGLRCELHPVSGQDGAPLLQRHQPLPVHRFYEPEGPEFPVEAVLTARLRPSRDGEFKLAVRPPFKGRILLDGRPVFDSRRAGPPLEETVTLRAGRTRALRVECRVPSEYDHPRTLILELREGQAESGSAIPWEWLEASRG